MFFSFFAFFRNLEIDRSDEPVFRKRQIKDSMPVLPSPILYGVGCMISITSDWMFEGKLSPQRPSSLKNAAVGQIT